MRPGAGVSMARSPRVLPRRRGTRGKSGAAPRTPTTLNRLLKEVSGDVKSASGLFKGRCGVRPRAVRYQ